MDNEIYEADYFLLAVEDIISVGTVLYRNNICENGVVMEI